LEREAKKAPLNYKMKTKLAILALCVSALTARATLIDFTPGGWTGQFPPNVNQWTDTTLQTLTGFDVAVLNNPTYGTGWVGNGFVPGGTYFNTNLFTFTSDPISCQVTWNFPGGLPSSWELSWIWVIGNNWNNIYQVPLDQLLAGNGTITLDGIHGINEIGFFGQHIDPSVIPESGWTLWLFLIGTGLLVTYEITLRILTENSNRADPNR